MARALSLAALTVLELTPVERARRALAATKRVLAQLEP
jgi:hypothetical protein